MGNITNELVEAARAVIDRWHTPKWKDVESTACFINRLENALRQKETSDNNDLTQRRQVLEFLGIEDLYTLVVSKVSYTDDGYRDVPDAVIQTIRQALSAPVAVEADKMVEVTGEQNIIGFQVTNIEGGKTKLTITDIFSSAEEINRAVDNYRANTKMVEVTVKELGKDIELWRFDDEVDGTFGEYLRDTYPHGLKIKGGE